MTLSESEHDQIIMDDVKELQVSFCTTQIETKYSCQIETKLHAIIPTIACTCLDVF
jgi:hypothetical protein